MPATLIHPKDVSALGLIAQRPAKTESRALVNGLSRNAKPIGRALTGHASQRHKRNIVETVTYLHEWAGGGNEIAVSNGTRRSSRSLKASKKKAAKRKRK
jgi:hypothetical protein